MQKTMMMSLMFLVVAMTTSVGVTSASGDFVIEEEDDVVVLTEENFDEALSELTPMFVEFYASWCGHCTALAPDFSETSRILKSQGSPIRLAKVNAPDNKELADKYGVESFPTLKFFPAGGKPPVPYPKRGRRQPINFLRWLKKQTGPAADRVETVKAAQKIISDERLVALGFFKDADSSASEAFMKVAAENDDYVFLTTSRNALFNEYKASDGSVIIFRQFDERRVDFTEPQLTAESLTDFLVKYRRQLVTELTPKEAPEVFSDANIQRQLILFVSRTSPDLNAHIETLREVASLVRGKIIVAYSTIDEEESQRYKEYFGIRDAECPVVLLNDFVKSLKYKPLVGHQLTTGKILLFVNDAVDDKLKPYLKSQPLPADWNSKPVKFLVGTNLEGFVKSAAAEKKVFIKFYTPWCGHCKELAPIWQQLGEHYEGQSEVVIAEFDTSANDVSFLPVRSLPTLALFPKGGGEPIMYTGNRTLEELVQFVDRDGKEQTKDEEAAAAAGKKAGKSEL
jgi:protein disulfide-isomerase A1